MRKEFLLFLEYLRLSKGRSERTLEIYRQIIADFDKYLARPRIVGLSTASYSEEVARAYLRSRALDISPVTQSLYVSVLRGLSKWLKSEEYIDLAWNLKSPKVMKKKMRIFAEEDLDLLVKVISSKAPEEQILFHLLYGSALRISEALSLECGNIFLQQKKARVLGKGSRWREVPLTAQAVGLLSQCLKRKAAPTITSHTWHGASLPYSLARNWVQAWGEESGISAKYGAMHPHLLRHALASHLLRRGAKLPHIQKLLGHRHLSTTEKYTHLELDDLLRVYDRAMPKKLSHG